jgi:hypothetical protein
MQKRPDIVNDLTDRFIAIRDIKGMDSGSAR